jgi:serine protease Do
MADTDFGEVTDRLRRATVQIGAGRGSSGSGVIWSQDGTIVTNAHVAGGGSVKVILWDGRKLDADVVARDLRNDLARLRVDRDKLPAATFRDSSSVAPGEIVFAVGNPLGFVGALSTGIVHAVGPHPNLGRKTWVQAAVRLAPGNSGGPLADSEGHVIGINTMVMNGLGFAVPSNTLAKFIAAGTRKRAELGVTIRPVAIRHAGRSGLGLLVLEVGRGSAAEAASLKSGDLLIGVRGNVFESMDDLQDAIENARGPFTLDFVRPPQENLRHVSVVIVEQVAGAA